MTLMVLEKVPAALRGELTRWFLEIHTGVFVGRVSALVRDKLWELTCNRIRDGASILVYTSDTEQGFAIRFCGPTGRLVRDFEGLSLLTQA